jgi:uncharacterized protein
MTEPTAAPVTAAERIDLLDGLRGFALFGILLANILYWSGWLFLPLDRAVAIAGAGQFAIDAFLHKLLIDGKFYTIFSLLFGIGFALQLSRLERRGADGVRIFRRRLLVLLAIGLVHLCLVWDGDILTLYALLGLCLPFFRKWSERRILLAGLGFLLLPLLGGPLFNALGWTPGALFYDLGNSIAEPQGLHFGGESDWLARPDWHSHFVWIASGSAYRVAMLLEWWRLPKVFGIMLIGMAMGRRLIEGRLLEDRKLLRRVCLWGMLIGLPLSLLYALDLKLGQDSVVAILGTAPLGFAYAAGFALLWPHAKWLAVLAPPGRMALTNYLMQTLLGITIFYGIGFGLVNHLPPLGFYAVAVAIFAFQIVFSRWWLARHAQGPMEWLWRRGTYGRNG